MARRNASDSLILVTAVVSAVVIALIGFAVRAPLRARALHDRAARDAPQTAPPGAVPAPETPPAAAVTAPLPAGPAPDLDLVFTDQVVGYIEPCG